MKQEQISAIIDQAKQQRAEYIGKSVAKHPILALIVVAVPVLLTQVQWAPSAPVAEHQASHAVPFRS